jgi:hypothetical protein
VFHAGAGGNVGGMVKRLFLLALVALAALSAFGLWVTESSGGPETDVASFYLLALGIGLAAAVVGGLVFMFTRRDRYGERGQSRASSTE